MSRKKDASRTPSPRVSIQCLARYLGVGAGSVSRALSGKGPVSVAMAERVRKAAKELGYEPNFLAQSLRTRSSQAIGFLISDITNPLLASIASGAEAVLSTAGYSLLLTNSGGLPDVDAERVRLFLQRRVDGLIVMPASESDPATVAPLAGADIPVVLIDREMPAVPNALSVLSDHSLGMTEATRHLLALGHRKIALLVGPPGRPAKERARAFQEAHTAASLSPFCIEYGPLTAERSRKAVGRFLESPQRPTAIILGGNQLLEGTLEIFRQSFVRHGPDIALVCCDDVPLGRLADPSISTVVRDTNTMGRAAATLLLECLAGATPSNRSLPTWFVPRGSTLDGPSDNPPMVT